MPASRPKKDPPSRAKYVVLRDSGEHEGKGWVFDESESCDGTQKANLYTGDYSLEGYYDTKCFVIERKGSVSELVANISQKERWEDFANELARLEEFSHPFVICEFPYKLLETYPRGSDVPQRLWDKIRVKPHFLVKRFWEIQLAFKTKFTFTSGSGRDAASSLFKRVVETCKPPTPGGNSSKPAS